MPEIHLYGFRVYQDLALASRFNLPHRRVLQFMAPSLTMRMNQRMRGYLSHLQSAERVLSPELSSVLVSGFVEENGCVLLASEARDSRSIRTATQDETGYECFINHLHVKNLAEALEFAKRLQGVLAQDFTGVFVVIVSFDGIEATVRFHKHREGQTWLNDNLEWYGEEGIAVFDSD